MWSGRLSQAWLEQPERGSILAIRLSVGLALLLGRRIARMTLVPVALHFLLFADNARVASRDYLRRGLDRPDRFRGLFCHHFTFPSVALDRFFLFKGRIGFFFSQIDRGEGVQGNFVEGEG